MKRTLYVSMFLVLFSIFIIGAEAFGAKSLYDDFSGTYLDSEKWKDRELVREVVGGKLVSKIGNATGTGDFRNSTSFIDPTLINTIECDLTVVATNLDTGSEQSSHLRIGGFFYNTSASGAGATGDIFAGAYIGDRGSGLEAYWVVAEALNDDLTNFEERDSGTLPTGTLNYGTAYTAKVAYDGTNGFVFTVAGVSSGSVTGPTWQRDAVTEHKGLATGIGSDSGTGTGYASALFDNVNTNTATPYDDFSTASLDPTKWRELEFVREISGGKLPLNVQADGSWRSATIEPNDQTTAYLETKVTVESGSQVSPGAESNSRIGCYYYNVSRGPGSGQDYNGYQGNAWASGRIVLDDNGNLTGWCGVFRHDDSESSGPGTMLFHQDFTTSFAFDTEYTLSIEFTGSTLIFKCNNETYQYDVTTPMYPPSIGQYRHLQSRVWADPGESGYMKANFDDVYTGYTAQATYDATGTWDMTETDFWNSCDPDEQPETSTITITQSGNDVTMVDDEGNTFTGTANGSYYTLYGEVLEEGEPLRIYVTFILSSITSGSGSHNFTWTDGVNWCEGGGFFTLAKDTTPPTVSSTTPADNDTDVAVDTAITASFSEAMDSSTITTDTFLVSGSSNIAGTVAYSGTTASFTPTTALDYNKTYTATITTGAKDLAGNALEADYTWSFTTGSASATTTTTGGGGGGGGGCFIATAAFGSNGK